MRVWVLGWLLVATCTPSASGEDAAASVMAKLESLAASRVGAPASIGFCMLDLESGAEVVGYRANRVLIPASTMKVVSTGTALAMLGAEHQIATRLQITGDLDPETGILSGDVILHGGGDPTLAKDGVTPLFRQWVSALKEAGVQSVEGRVIGDESLFDTQIVPGESLWIDLGNYFGAGSSALSAAKNEYRVSFRTGSPGSPARLTDTTPTPPGVRFINEMRAGPYGSGDEGYIFAGPYASVAYLRGTVPPGRSRFSIRGSLPDPARYVAERFHAFLGDAGVEVKGAATTSRLLAADDETLPKERRTLHTTESVSLGTMLVDTNRWSRNLNADCLLKLTGAFQEGVGGFRSGAKAVKAFWKARGVDLSTAQITDGSGLSHTNLLSARQLAGLLYGLHQSPVGEVFRNSLPIAGRNGTIRNFGNGTHFDGRYRAKTGTMDGIKCVAGYLRAASGKEYVLVFLFNHYEGSHGSAVSAMEQVISTATARF